MGRKKDYTKLLEGKKSNSFKGTVAFQKTAREVFNFVKQSSGQLTSFLNSKSQLSKFKDRRKKKRRKAKVMKPINDSDGSMSDDEHEKKKKKKRQHNDDEIDEELTPQEMHKKILVEDNEREEITIRQLEKKLKLRKYEGKELPSSYHVDGFDYILKACAPDILKDDESDQGDDDSDEEEEVEDLDAPEEVSSRCKVLDTSVNKKLKKDLKLLQKDEWKYGKLNEKKDDSDGSGDEDEMSGDDNENDISMDSEDESDVVGDEVNGLKDDDVESEVHNDQQSSTHQPTRKKVMWKSDTDIVSVHTYDSRKPVDPTSVLPKKKKEQKTKDTGTWEDIYGRMRDDAGNVVNESPSIKYIPPAKKRKMSQQELDSTQASRKQLKGLLNKLNDTNIHLIGKQIEDMFMNNSRSEMNENLYSLLSEATILPTLAPERLTQVYALLIAMLHGNVGNEVGAFFLQAIIKHFDQLYNQQEDDTEDKRCNNILIFVCCLYNFEIIHSRLLVDILKKLGDSFAERDIEMILLILKNVGIVLRKEDPVGLKELILHLQTKAANVKSGVDKLRVKFMLEVVMAIKNNNILKIPNYNPVRVQNYKKQLKALLHKGNSVSTLPIPLADLLRADTQGRWWIIGSAWTGNQDQDQQHDKVKKAELPLPQGKLGQKMLALARKHRMNTDVRKSIFCTIMMAEDFQDAFHRLERLELKPGQRVECINVVMYCFQQENMFNPFYAHLLKLLCEKRSYLQQTKAALLDRLKNLSTLTEDTRTSLAQLIAHLVITSKLRLQILQVLEFVDLDANQVKFLRNIMVTILTHDSDKVVTEVFSKIPPDDNTRVFRESLQVFMKHFIVGCLPELNVLTSLKPKLKQRVKLANKVLKKLAAQSGDDATFTEVQDDDDDAENGDSGMFNRDDLEGDDEN